MISSPWWSPAQEGGGFGWAVTGEKQSIEGRNEEFRSEAEAAVKRSHRWAPHRRVTTLGTLDLLTLASRAASGVDGAVSRARIADDGCGGALPAALAFDDDGVASNWLCDGGAIASKGLRDGGDGGAGVGAGFDAATAVVRSLTCSSNKNVIVASVLPPWRCKAPSRRAVDAAGKISRNSSSTSDCIVQRTATGVFAPF